MVGGSVSGNDVNAAGRERLGTRREKRTEARLYTQPATGLEAPSHSTVLKVLPKPALDNWKLKNSVTWTIANQHRWHGMELEDAVNMVMAAKHNPEYDAAAVGDQAHLIYENLALGYDPIEFGVPDGYEGILDFWEEMVEEFELEIFAVEPRVHNYVLNISGSPDLLVYGMFPDWKGEVDRRLAVLDYKTGNGLYGSTAYQNMYTALAQTYQLEGWIKDRREEELPPITASFGVWVRPEGWALIPLDMGDDVQVVCRAARALYDRVDTTRYTWTEAKYKGKAINANPIKSKRGDWPAIERKGDRV
jgi:hypothetical protein